jgi:hypothetical protein
MASAELIRRSSGAGVGDTVAGGDAAEVRDRPVVEAEDSASGEIAEAPIDGVDGRAVVEFEEATSLAGETAGDELEGLEVVPRAS